MTHRPPRSPATRYERIRRNIAATFRPSSADDRLPALPLALELADRRDRAFRAQLDPYRAELAAERARAAAVGAPGAPNLDTTGTSCTHPPAEAAPAEPFPWADQAWHHVFRENVSDALIRAWPERGAALLECGKAPVLLSCGSCSTPHLVPFRCGARTCPHCSRAAAAALAARAAARVAVFNLLMEAQPWDGAADVPERHRRRRWQLVTLTSRAPADLDRRFQPAELRARVRQVRSAVGVWWRSTAWGRQRHDRRPVVTEDGELVTLASGAPKTRRVKRSRLDTAYIAGEEVSPRGMVHVHLAVFGEFIHPRALQAAWSAALGESARIDVRQVQGDSPEAIAAALREVLKYATKGAKGSPIQARRAAAVELAYRHVRRVSIGGALRNVRIGDDDAASDDARPDDLHDQKRASCDECKAVGSWVWEGRLPAAVTLRNGGFGRLHRRAGAPFRALEWGDALEPPPRVSPPPPAPPPRRHHGTA